MSLGPDANLFHSRSDIGSGSTRPGTSHDDHVCTPLGSEATAQASEISPCLQQTTCSVITPTSVQCRQRRSHGGTSRSRRHDQTSRACSLERRAKDPVITSSMSPPPPNRHRQRGGNPGFPTDSSDCELSDHRGHRQPSIPHSGRRSQRGETPSTQNLVTTNLTRYDSRMSTTHTTDRSVPRPKIFNNDLNEGFPYPRWLRAMEAKLECYHLPHRRRLTGLRSVTHWRPCLGHARSPCSFDPRSLQHADSSPLLLPRGSV